MAENSNYSRNFEMIIGNGMMANAFKECALPNNVIIFASGVSNSQERDPEPYKREVELLNSIKGTDATLIYFSTCSIFDPSLLGSHYVQHKRKIENLIETSFHRYWIFRLPNVIGSSKNPHTMTNFLSYAIKNDCKFDVQEKAYRYFIDVEDVRKVILTVIEQRKLPYGSYNLLFQQPYSVKDVVHQLEKKFNKKGDYILRKDAGNYYEVKISPELLPFIHFHSLDPDEYLSEVLDKYYH